MKYEQIEKIIKEFNEEGSNDNVLGKYLVNFANHMANFTELSLEENIRADKEINDWLRNTLTMTYNQGKQDALTEILPTQSQE